MILRPIAFLSKKEQTSIGSMPRYRAIAAGLMLGFRQTYPHDCRIRFRVPVGHRHEMYAWLGRHAPGWCILQYGPRNGIGKERDWWIGFTGPDQAFEFKMRWL